MKKLLHLLLLFSMSVFGQDEFYGPFPSWMQTTAIGDSATDDTQALQNNIDIGSSIVSVKRVLYLKSGTYRLSSQLNGKGIINFAILGSHPDSVRIIWSGAPNGTMLYLNGVAYSRFGRITWDGKGIAANAIDQSWDGRNPHFDSGNEYLDMTFKNLKHGIIGGHSGYGFAETTIKRCKFYKNTSSGITLGNFNALDIWIWNCLFEDCTVGVTNHFGAGNFKVYYSVFRRSTETDIKTGNTGEFSFRHNSSLNSNRFIDMTGTNNPAPTVIQSNRIIDPVETVMIGVKHQGPTSYIDNVVRTRANETNQPRVWNIGLPTSDAFWVGNTFSIAQFGTPIWADRYINNPHNMVTRASLSGMQEVVIPPCPQRATRQVFEANAANAQAQINAAIGGIVHFAHGSYNISNTLVVPENVQITGDGDGDAYATKLNWTGAPGQPMFKIAKRSSINNLYIGGAGIETTDDVYLHQTHIHGNDYGLLVKGAGKVYAENSGFSQANVAAIKVENGGEVVLFAGAQSNNNLTYKVDIGGKVLVRDVWYESHTTAPVFDVAGKIWVEGSHFTTQTGAFISQGSITGQGVFINNVIDGKLTGNNITGIGNLVNPEWSTGTTLVSRMRDPNANQSGSGSLHLPNVGTYNAATEALLNEFRQEYTIPANSIHLRKIWIVNSSTGLLVNKSLAPLAIRLFNVLKKNGTVVIEFSGNAEVYKSKDGQKFELIGQGDNTFTDMKPYPGKNFYRIKQGSEYSKVKWIEFAHSTIYPNPVKDILNITSDYSFNKATIRNLSGQSIKSDQVTNNSINVKDLKPGFYTIELSGAGIIIKRIFIKQ